MKKSLILLVAGLLVVAMASSCSMFVGDDGRVYITVEYDDMTTYGFDTDGLLMDCPELPSLTSADDQIQVDEGSYALDYVIYDNKWGDYIGDSSDDYVTEFNDSLGTIIYSDSDFFYDWSENIEWYETDFFSDRANSFTFYVSAEEGALFRDGDDSYYTINLDWVASNTNISSLGTTDADMKIIEESDEKVIKELTDGAFTLRIEIDKVPAPTTNDIMGLP